MATISFEVSFSGTPQTSLKPPIIITGMHRSGTSLAASLLQSMGVNVGESLLGPAQGNPHGHFEDTRFFSFHEQLMDRHGAHWGLLPDGTGATLQLTDIDVVRAKSLIESNAGKPLWGWKDPRSSIFLPFWHYLLPNARFFLVFRHPAAVAMSLFRRNTDPLLLHDVWTPFRAWNTYNSSIVGFVATSPQWWYLCDIESLVNSLDELPEVLQRRLGFGYLRSPDRGLFEREDLHALPLEAIQRIEEILTIAEPAVMLTYQRLLAISREQDAHAATELGADEVPALDDAKRNELGAELAAILRRNVGVPTSALPLS